MKTLYLHISTPKTATSSIQTFLELNRDLLPDCRYCFPMDVSYPDVPDRRNGHFLVFRSERLKKEDRKAPEERLARGLDMIHRAFQNCDNVILSEENLWFATAYDSRNYLQILPKDAAEHGYRVKIIVYLRRQDQFVSSVWNQRVKRRLTSQTLPDYITHILRDRPYYLDYDKTLSLAADTFGKENLIVRRFEASAWKNHSVLSDFIDALGLDPAYPFIMPEREVNPRLTDNAAELQRIINKADFLPEEEKEYLSGYTKKLSENSNGPSYSRFTPEETVDFLSRYEEGNRHIVQTYLKDGKPLFSDEISDLPLWKPDNPEMLQDSTWLFLSVFHDMNRQLKNLKRFRQKLRHPLHTLFGKLGQK